MVAPSQRRTQVRPTIRWKKEGIPRGLSSGWAILRLAPTPAYLQIATGLWCPADQATWFPLRSTAEAYARDLRIAAKVVHLTRRSTGELVQQSTDVLAHPRRRLA